MAQLKINLFDYTQREIFCDFYHFELAVNEDSPQNAVFKKCQRGENSKSPSIIKQENVHRKGGCIRSVSPASRPPQRLPLGLSFVTNDIFTADFIWLKFAFSYFTPV